MQNQIVWCLKDDVATLCVAHDRTVGSAGHAAARTHLIERFREIGLEPYAGDTYELPYDVGRTRFVNVVGVAAGRTAGVRPVLVGAHYDTVPGTPGADDNAAAIAIALEVAGRVAMSPAARPVVIAHFDAEEPPFFRSTNMGSTQMDGALEHDTTTSDTEHLRRVLGPHAAVLGLHGPGDFDRVVRQVVGEIQGV